VRLRALSAQPIGGGGVSCRSLFTLAQPGGALACAGGGGGGRGGAAGDAAGGADARAARAGSSEY